MSFNTLKWIWVILAAGLGIDILIICLTVKDWNAPLSAGQGIPLFTLGVGANAATYALYLKRRERGD